jgi:tetratricopeptide (TPR) repeat protein
LKYEDKLLPDPFKEGEEYSALYNEYCQIIDKRSGLKSDSIDTWLVNMKDKLDEIKKAVPGTVHECKKFIYWKKMEDAYITFFSGKFDEAISKYEEIKRKTIFCERPVLNFRLGELFFIKDQLEESLKYFDLSEQCMSDSMQENKFRIKIKVAFIYWMLGEEYFPIVIETINDAYDIYTGAKQDDPVFDENDYSLITNLMCWYHLDMHIMLVRRVKSLNELVHKYNLSDEEKVKKEEKINLLAEEAESNYQISLHHYDILVKDIMATGRVSSNVYDTAAWFCYQTYKKTNDMKHLEEAYLFCDHLLGHNNDATFLMSSFNKQRSHIVEIMNARLECKMETKKPA